MADKLASTCRIYCLRYTVHTSHNFIWSGVTWDRPEFTESSSSRERAGAFCGCSPGEQAEAGGESRQNAKAKRPRHTAVAVLIKQVPAAACAHQQQQHTRRRGLYAGWRGLLPVQQALQSATRYCYT